MKLIYIQYANFISVKKETFIFFNLLVFHKCNYLLFSSDDCILPSTSSSVSTDLASHPSVSTDLASHPSQAECSFKGKTWKCSKEHLDNYGEGKSTTSLSDYLVVSAIVKLGKIGCLQYFKL